MTTPTPHHRYEDTYAITGMTTSTPSQVWRHLRHHRYDDTYAITGKTTPTLCAVTHKHSEYIIDVKTQRTCLEVLVHIYPEWPHRQGGCLACCGSTFDSAEVHWFILCSRRSGGTAHEGRGCYQSIGSTVSDAIVRSWLWLTATRSSP